MLPYPPRRSRRVDKPPAAGVHRHMAAEEQQIARLRLPVLDFAQDCGLLHHRVAVERQPAHPIAHKRQPRAVHARVRFAAPAVLRPEEGLRRAHDSPARRPLVRRRGQRRQAFLADAADGFVGHIHEREPRLGLGIGRVDHAAHRQHHPRRAAVFGREQQIGKGYADDPRRLLAARAQVAAAQIAAVAVVGLDAAVVVHRVQQFADGAEQQLVGHLAFGVGIAVEDGGRRANDHFAFSFVGNFLKR